MAKDPSLTKNYEGTFIGGQGPVMGQSVVTESETKEIHGGEGTHITLSSDGGHDAKPGGEDQQFNLHGVSYKGPENWIPENKGDVSPNIMSRG